MRGFFGKDFTDSTVCLGFFWHGLRGFGFLLLREKFRTYGKASESLPQRQAETQI